jgi:hypothetical protein
MTIAPVPGPGEVTLHRLVWVGPATVAVAVLAVLVVQKISLAMPGSHCLATRKRRSDRVWLLMRSDLHAQ